MIGLLPILARWKWGLGLAGVVAVLGLIGALSHYRSAYHAEKALRKAQEAAYTNAQAIAAERAQRALEVTEDAYRSKANESDQSFKLQMADVRGAADRYIAAHRMRVKSPSRDASGTVASASGGNPGVPADMPADAVMVFEGDVRACTDASAYAVAAHSWALGLKTGQ